MKSTIVNGIKIYNFSSSKQLIEYAFMEKKSLIAINAEKVLNADEQMREMINNNIGYCDGIGAVWALKRKGFKDAVKIPGCELWLNIIGSYYHEKSFYVVGGSLEVVEQTVTKLKNEFHGIKILNFRDGYISDEIETDDLIFDIETKNPDVVFLAIGSPKQELLMERMHRFHPAVYLGLGGSFDVYVGKVHRAPKWWIKNNLEWAYRLVKQPARIKRQIFLVRFLWLLLTNKL